MQNPLQPVVGQWTEKIRLALDFKRTRFQPDADEGMKFFRGPYDFLYGSGRKRDKYFKESFDEEDDTEIPMPKFQMTVNKVAELVQIFGPVLYHRNPVRQVNPRAYPAVPAGLMAVAQTDPNTLMQFQVLDAQAAAVRAVDEARAGLLQHYLNYTPTALDLKTESRWAIDEALIKGLGLLWTEVYTPPGGASKMVGSFFDSVDNLVIDPDMPSLRHCKWVARKRTRPVWEVEREYGLAPGSLRANLESTSRQAEVAANPDGSYYRATGQTADLVVYWEVFSKCGLGGRLKGVAAWQGDELEAYGDFCYLCVCEGVAYPLNVPERVWDMPADQGRQVIAQRVQWPTPFWADDAWPFTPIAFHDVPEDPWPMSHIAPGLGELKFLNWMYSFIAGKIRISCRDFIAVLKQAGEEIKSAILKGTDYEIIEVSASHGKSINELVQFLQHPPFHGDIWRVIEAVAEQFDRRVGLTELMYGESARQLRSAQEANIKSSQMSVRPDDMANRVEDAMAMVARQEALAARWHLTPEDVGPVMGPVGQALWQRYVTPSDPGEILYQLEYRIEAGSTKKPNKARDAENMQSAMQNLMAFFQNLAIQGLTGPFNALVTAWAKSIDLDPSGFTLPTPQPMAPPPPQGGGPGGPPPQGQRPGQAPAPAGPPMQPPMGPPPMMGM